MMRSIPSSIAALQLLLLVILPSSAEALTITTFNILAPVHRSMDLRNTRESEREDWWRPRAEGVADYISRKFAASDVVLLQEWWFDEQFTSVFNAELGDAFEMVAERRPGTDGKMRDDGMCCLVKKGGKLELVKSGNVLTGPQRIAQIVQCREKCSSGGGRDVFIANSHLSYPGDQDPVVNDQRQAAEASIILDALSKASSTWGTSHHEERLEVVCGDFNSNSQGLAASLVESPPNSFVNCVSATADRNLANVGGQVNIGTTHCDHRGLKVSVDHIFLRLARRRAEQKSRGDGNKCSKKNRCAALSLGYLDTKGSRILSVRRGNIQLEGSTVLSDHRPITAKIAWPRTSVPKERLSSMYVNATLPLDPLEPAWGVLED